MRPRKKYRSRLRRRLSAQSLESRMMLHAEGILSGSVFFDTDGNGLRGPAETGVPGVVVELSSADMSMKRSTITDDQGNYLFDELLPGDYQISKRKASATSQDTSAGFVSIDLTLEDDQNLGGNQFVEASLRPEFINVAWFFASAPSESALLRESIALAEDLSGDPSLAAAIREGASDVPVDVSRAPVAGDDNYSVDENDTLTVGADTGVLADDTDANGDGLTAMLVRQASHGIAVLSGDGSFTYTPDADFFGNESFTYTASDGTATSNVATVSIRVTAVDPGTPFGEVTVGSFTDSGLLGIRTDLVAGAPAVTNNHVSGDIDYSAYSNPPTYGDHHPSDPTGSDSDPGITPRPTGIYTTEQPDEDLIHNLEHGHVWISYNPNLISAVDLEALQQLVRDGTGDVDGNGAGVILTPRAADDSVIALASWAHLLKLDGFDPDTIRDFIDTNRGHAPEGFITP